MVVLRTMNSSAFTPVGAVNETTADFRVDPLPSELTVDGTTVFIYGDGQTMTDTAIIQRVPSTMVGSISTVSFIYMLMSLIIIVIMVPYSLEWIRAVTGQDGGTPPPAPTLTEREFRRQLSPHYPNPPLPSYVETVTRTSGATATSQDLWECRQLIRSKYALDLSIYNHRDVAAVGRHRVDDMRRRSAGALIDIQQTVKGWANAKDKWSEEELEKVEEIHNRIEELVARSNAQQGNGNI